MFKIAKNLNQNLKLLNNCSLKLICNSILAYLKDHQYVVLSILNENKLIYSTTKFKLYESIK